MIRIKPWLFLIDGRFLKQGEIDIWLKCRTVYTNFERKNLVVSCFSGSPVGQSEDYFWFRMWPWQHLATAQKFFWIVFLKLISGGGKSSHDMILQAQKTLSPVAFMVFGAVSDFANWRLTLTLFFQMLIYSGFLTTLDCCRIGWIIWSPRVSWLFSSFWRLNFLLKDRLIKALIAKIGGLQKRQQDSFYHALKLED